MDTPLSASVKYALGCSRQSQTAGGCLTASVGLGASPKKLMCYNFSPFGLATQTGK